MQITDFYHLCSDTVEVNLIVFWCSKHYKKEEELLHARVCKFFEYIDKLAVIDLIWPTRQTECKNTVVYLHIQVISP